MEQGLQDRVRERAEAWARVLEQEFGVSFKDQGELVNPQLLQKQAEWEQVKAGEWGWGEVRALAVEVVAAGDGSSREGVRPMGETAGKGEALCQEEMDQVLQEWAP
jgi:hypothetical protein